MKEVIDRIEIELQYPIGCVMRLKNDYPGITREVLGHEYLDGAENIVFRDGGKLNMQNLNLIEWSR